ncbi:MAG: fumarylacetoacetate hydrolase family protein [Phycisphaerae bacterium]|nr:fumarylacetoacetate hydrolase family protein [Phycisphaerae bacterium]
MKLITFSRPDGTQTAGVVRDGKVIDVAKAAPNLPHTVRGLIEAGALPSLAEAANRADLAAAPDLETVTLCAPLPNPGKIVCLAGNYQEHIREGGGTEKDKAKSPPHLFMKPTTTILAPGAATPYPKVTDQLDHEIELGVVIGRSAKEVTVDQAADCVAGYMICNDVSSRRLVGLTTSDRTKSEREAFFDWLTGKWQDGALPMGPYLVTPDEIPDVHALTMTLTVNGEARQQGSTGQMIHTVPEIVAFASRLMTLEPADIISTGTPAGVGSSTGKFLHPGDRIECTIEGLGRLVSTIATS